MRMVPASGVSGLLGWLAITVVSNRSCPGYLHAVVKGSVPEVCRASVINPFA